LVAMTARFGLFVCALILLAGGAQRQAVAQEGGRAGVVVRFADDRVESRCVTFDVAEINGYTLLQRSGLVVDVKSEGQGGLVCAIDGTGCGVNDCLCQCQGDPCVYWSYWRRDDDGWTYSAAGSTIRRISDGDVDGWSWGPGSLTSAIEPPLLTFDEICSAETEAVGELADAEASASTGWPTYTLFGLVIVVIGVGALIANKRKGVS